jgi:hypothetical protein
LGIEDITQHFAAVAGFSPVFDLKALAIVGNDSEKICARSSALTRPQRFQQAGEKGGQAKDLQKKASPPNPSNRCGTVAPDQQAEGEEQR